MRWGPILLISLLAAPAAAQIAPETPGEDALAAERLMMLPPREKKPRCKDEDKNPGEIVVCGRTTETEKYRVKSSADDDPLSPGARRGGVPHTGQSLVTNLRDCSPGSGNRCRSIGRAPAPIYYFDITKLPPPPPGSDADLIAKGEKRAP